MPEFLVRHRASIYLSLAILILAALMMRPSFMSWIALVGLAGLVTLMRDAALAEGRVHGPTKLALSLGAGLIGLAFICGWAAAHFYSGLMVLD